MSYTLPSFCRNFLPYTSVASLALLLTMCAPAKPAQSSASTTQAIQVEGPVYDTVDQSPEFVGGPIQMYQFIANNMRYPITAQRAKIQGKPVVVFVVTKNGDLANIKTTTTIGYGLEEEAIRVISLMPGWKPGSKDGVAVNTNYTIPINFTLLN